MTNFEEFYYSLLNKLLKSFYFDARTVTGELYKASSLENLRHSLNRYLQSPPHSRLHVDIVKNVRFQEANEAYKSAIKELKSVGKGSVTHYRRISDSDLQKIYQSVDINTPTGLMQKVQFDVRFYFCRRGMENMPNMNKNTFATKTHASGVLYVYICQDELKNHRDIGMHTLDLCLQPQEILCAQCRYFKSC